MSEAEATPPPGKITIAPEALLTIAQLSALSVPGVAGTSPIPGGVNRWLKRDEVEGVRIEVRDAGVLVDLYLVVNPATNLREVSRAVQAEVARAIHEMVGMEVQCVNIYIEDVAPLMGSTQ